MRSWRLCGRGPPGLWRLWDRALCRFRGVARVIGERRHAGLSQGHKSKDKARSGAGDALTDKRFGPDGNRISQKRETRMTTTGLADLLLMVLLLAVIFYDLRFMILPNRLAGLFVLLFITAVAWTLAVDELAWRIGLALGLLTLGIMANAVRLVGGGDVKVLSALILFVPHEDLLGFFLALCLGTVAGIAGLMALRLALKDRQVTWKGLQNTGSYPFGISIGIAGLTLLLM